MPERLDVHADRDRLDQVLTNLIENAVKYSPDGGPVRVVAERRGGEVEVRVSDVGVGIPPEHLDHVFERFYQADGDAGRRGSAASVWACTSAAPSSTPRRSHLAAQCRRWCRIGVRLPHAAGLDAARPRDRPDRQPPAFVVRRRDG